MHARSEAILSEVPEAFRPAVRAELTYALNTYGSGWRPSDLLARIVKGFLAGGDLESPVAQSYERLARATMGATTSAVFS